MRKKLASLTTMLFLAFIIGIGAVNAIHIFPEIKTAAKTDETYFSEGGKRLEEEYRTQFWKRRDWINLYGAAQKAAGRRVIGEMQFVRTDEGLMDYVSKEENVLPFANEMVELKQRLDADNLPLFYIQMPARADSSDSTPEILLRTNEYYREIRSVTDAAGIRCMDETEILAGEQAPDRAEFFFKTDIHMTTEAEIWMANKIANLLNTECGTDIQNLIQTDDERYEKNTYLFLGNLAQSAGVCYNGIDRFEEYVPKNQGNFRMSELQGQWEVSGGFEEVLMNGYSENSEEEEMYTYWVTDFLRYGTGGYNIENVEQEDTNLLVICDSLCYRTLSYLAMECANITILDPRFYADGTDMVELALNQRDYDAVIYLHGSFYTTDYSMFGRGIFQ